MRIPILKLKGILLTTIQEELTDEESLDFQSDVTCAVADNEAEGIVIDISALDIIDSFMARVLNETVTMVQLLGAEAVICGMQPAVALTLIEMGRELIHIESVLDLDQGLEKIQELVNSRTKILR